MSDNKNKKNTYELLLSYSNLCCFAYCYFQLIFYDYDDLIYCPYIYIYIYEEMINYYPQTLIRLCDNVTFLLCNKVQKELHLLKQQETFAVKIYAYMKS